MNELQEQLIAEQQESARQTAIAKQAESHVQEIRQALDKRIAELEALLSSTQADLAGQCDSQATLAKEVLYLEENLRQVSDFMHHSKDTNF